MPQRELFTFNDLADRTVVLTGAALGIGRGLSIGLSRQRCRLILIDREQAKLEAHAEFLRESGTEVHTVICDLADPQARQDAARQVAAQTQNLHAIIHNAGIDPRMPLERTSNDFFRQVIATNVEPAVDLTRELLPALRQNGGGRVILLGSVTFQLGTAMLSAYVASKGALVGLARSLAHELGPDGITVNCIAPGAIYVEKVQALYTPEVEQAILKVQSVKRRLVPEDLLGLVCLLLSDAGSAISGQEITVDGGLLHPIADADVQRRMLDDDAGP